jgi:hypothetical protein
MSKAPTGKQLEKLALPVKYRHEQAVLENEGAFQKRLEALRASVPLNYPPLNVPTPERDVEHPKLRGEVGRYAGYMAMELASSKQASTPGSEVVQLEGGLKNFAYAYAVVRV